MSNKTVDKKVGCNGDRLLKRLIAKEVNPNCVMKK